MHFRKHFVQEKLAVVCLDFKWLLSHYIPDSSGTKQLRVPSLFVRWHSTRSAAYTGRHSQCHIPSSNTSQLGLCHWWRLTSGSQISESRIGPHPPFTTTTAPAALETTCTSAAMPGAGHPTLSSHCAPGPRSNHAGSWVCCPKWMWHLSMPG